jgi:hypothetical protein
MPSRELEAGPDGSQSAQAAHLSKETPPEEAVSKATREDAVLLKGLDSHSHTVDAHDHAAIRGIDHWQDIQLKKTYAKWLLILVAAQLLVADAVFVTYAWAGNGWHLEASVIQVWLGATLVELIGVALVITRYLFPRRDGASGLGT